jgi:Tfp pilus assembly protein PilF
MSYVRGLDDVKRLYRAGRYEAAAEYLKDLDTDYPNDPKVMAMLGTVYLKIGQEDLARQYWERVLQVDPGNREVIEALKQLNARRARPAQPRSVPERPVEQPAPSTP